VRALAPVVFAEERGQPFALTWLPLSPAFELGEAVSVPHLLEEVASRVKPDPDFPRRAYSRFIGLSEAVARHLRELAETPGCGASSLMWYIGRAVRHVARVHRRLLAKATPDVATPDVTQELAKGASWHVACLWAAFKKTPPVGVQWADDVVEQITAIGMSFCDTAFTDVVTACGSAIRSIAGSVIGAARSPYDVADLLMGIWKLRIFAEMHGLGEVVRDLDKRLERPPEIKDDQWHFYEEALALRKRQFEEELTEGDRISLSMSEPAMLIFQARHKAKVPAENPGEES
jgi:hypothetical protein